MTGKTRVGGALVVPPGTGSRVGNVELLAETADTPRFNLAVFVKEPHSDGPGTHVHEDEDDCFYVLEGELEFTVGSQTVAAPAGTLVLVPPGVPHDFANRCDRPARVLNVHAPGGWDARIRAA